MRGQAAEFALILAALSLLCMGAFALVLLSASVSYNAQTARTSHYGAYGAPCKTPSPYSNDWSCEKP